MTDIDAIRARHVPGRNPVWCNFDNQPWPCDTATVLAALDAAEATNTLHAKWWLEANRADAAEAREARLREALRGHHENGVCSVADPEAET